ncbi:MAG TPA: glycogen debranching N-terminal domain-containing protein [Gaiellaceae bacterium]|nr:glycogen debranching N-terminal domain-containing protein [Gaiellaceae bacterium]
MLTILEGSTFCISDTSGDIGGGTAGLFAADTRFLSRLLLRLDGKAPLLLSSGTVEYFSAAFFLRNDITSRLGQDAVSIDRRRFIGASGMAESLLIRNEGAEEVSFPLEIALSADFADIFAVKERDFALGHPDLAPPLTHTAAMEVAREGRELIFADGHGCARTQVILSRAGSYDSHGGALFALELAPRQEWELRLDVVPYPDGQVAAAPLVEMRFGSERERVRESLAAWHLLVPRVRCEWRNIEETISRSVADLASLRMRNEGTAGHLPAAGMPWFMTVFGRDTIITCLQTLIFGPDLARGALEALAALQAEADDPSIDAEPGKIVHELRRGRGAEAWFPAYYGTIDATPLFLVLLSETWRWTDDAALVTRLREPAMRALEWIDEWGDRDGDGFVEYERRAPRGLENQSWKDSGDSQRFANGDVAGPPIAPAEVQGYVYDAKLRLAEMAREAWDDAPLAARLESQADALQQRFDAAYWIDARGGYYALALDGSKRPVDSLCSNIGHLLWSGIVPRARAAAIADQLLSDDLWSGWGVRTMALSDAAYNPLSYHRGTVWPHDTSLAAWGLARYGFWAKAHILVRALFEAARWFEWSLPEVFAGFSRHQTPFPIVYPTAAKPQAWAAGAPVLCLQLLLGLQPERDARRLVNAARDVFPGWPGSLEVDGIRAFDRAWNAQARPGQGVVVEEA